MTDNIIFDFGRVLVQFDEYAMTEKYIHDKAAAEKISNIVFDRLYWDRLDDGSITDAQVLAGISARVPEKYRTAACEAYCNWYRHLPIIDGMPEILHDLKKAGKGLYLLSNISTGFAEHYAEVPELKALLERFDGCVFSGPIRLVKPHTEIFNYLLQKYSLSADTCTFVDDNIANVQAAERCGIEAYLFDGSAEKLRKYFGL